jgi:antitoxin HicB
LIDFPDCPGCQTFTDPGEDVEATAREALEGWLETHLEDGEAPPQPKARPRKTAGGHGIPVRIEPALAVRLAIRWARQEAGLSQGELAKKIGVTRQQISLLEAQGGNLTVATLQKIAAALGRDVDVTFVGHHSAALSHA